MSFLYDNIVAISVAAVCGGLAWLFGGTVAAPLLQTMPWLLVLLLEMMLCFPQRHPGETTLDARERVWGAYARDPLTWVVVVLLALLLVPFFNKGLCPCCDYPAIHFDGESEAPYVPYAPFCVNRLEHLNVTMWFLCALTAMLATKHSLLKRGKRMALEMIVWNGVALSAVGMLQRVTGAEGPLWTTGWERTAYFFSTFGYPNMGGDYFTTLFALSIALWRWNLAENARREADVDADGHRVKANHKRFWSLHAMLIPAVVFFFSAMMTLSRAAILLVSTLAVVFFVHSLASSLARMDGVRRVKVIAKNMAGIVLVATFFVVFLSNRDAIEESGSFRDGLQREVSTLDGRGILDRVSGRGQYHVRIAGQIWKDNFLFGCGGWGYKHFCIPKMTDADYAAQQKVGGINVHNDYLQFLAEHGIVGFGLVVAVCVMLLWPIVRVWKALVKAARFTKPKMRPPKPIAVFALPAGAFCILAACLATLVHAFADCPFRSPAVLSLFFVSLAAADGFLPKLNEK